MEKVPMCANQCCHHRTSCHPIPRDIAVIRSLYPRQFIDLCTVHLAFFIDIPVDYLHSPEPKPGRSVPVSRFVKLFSTSRSQETKSLVLSEILVKNLQFVISFLRKPENVSVDGLFRKSGNPSKQRRLESLITSDPSNNWKKNLHLYGVHNVAGAFKKLISQLTDPLLTRRLSDLFLQIPDLIPVTTNEHNSQDHHHVTEKQVRVAQILFLLLPHLNRTLFHATLALLHDVSRCHDNQMSSQALGIVFAPSLLAPAKMSSKDLVKQIPHFVDLVTFLVDGFEHVFKMPETLLRDVRLNLQNFRLGEEQFSERALVTCINFTTRKFPTRTPPLPVAEVPDENHPDTATDSGKISRRFQRKLRRPDRTNDASTSASDTPDSTNKSKINFAVKKRCFTRSKSRLPIPSRDLNTQLIAWNPLESPPRSRIARTVNSAPRLQALVNINNTKSGLSAVNLHSRMNTFLPQVSTSSLSVSSPLSRNPPVLRKRIRVTPL